MNYVLQYDISADSFVIIMESFLSFDTLMKINLTAGTRTQSTYTSLRLSLIKSGSNQDFASESVVSSKFIRYEKTLEQYLKRISEENI